jgi:hypothetical protein
MYNYIFIFYPKVYDKHWHTLQKKKKVQDLDLFLNMVKSQMKA